MKFTDKRKLSHRNKLLLFWLPTCLDISYLLHSILLLGLVHLAPKNNIRGAHFILSAAVRREP